MATSGKGSKAKGKSGELQLMHILRDFYGYEDVRRGKVFQGEPDLVGLHGIHIECKRVESLNVEKALLQAESEMAKKDPGNVPVVIHRKNQEKHWKVTLRAKDWDYLRFLTSWDEYMVHVSLEDFMDVYGAWIKGEYDEDE